MNFPTDNEKLAEVNGITLCYESFGDPKHPAMLLIMGLATQMIHWDERFCQKLADRGFWVIRFDNRDIGNSSKISHAKVPSLPSVFANQLFGRRLKVPYHLENMAEDALALLDFLNIDQCHVTGVSMGGMIAQCMAIIAPHRLLSLTSIMSTTGDPKLPKPKKSVVLKVMQPPPKEEQAYIQYALGLWKLLHQNHFEFDHQKVRSLLLKAKQRSYDPAGIWRQTCAILAAEDRTQKLTQLTMPCLVIHGDADPLVPVECGIATANAIPNATLKIFTGMGHTLPEPLWDEMIEQMVTNSLSGRSSNLI
ncbi:alpha/beta hydrolase [Aliiglaciecola litoralis]|uniref:Alpha/beta hydrolase n=1 Tax=Aliiglaciecola litoralis TaxID=582857 RepID=A0ABN1LQN5_9ALTE